MKKQGNKNGYSVILAILMIGFMLLLTTGVFSMVLIENKDTKAMEYYLQAYAGAEGALELALLKAKGYSYSHSNTSTEFIILSKNPLDASKFHKNKDVLIGYEIEATTPKIEEKALSSGDFNIIPLFHYDEHGNYKKVQKIEVSGLNGSVVWNIIGKEQGISGTGNITNTTVGNMKDISGGNPTFSFTGVSNFLGNSENNYLIIQNLSVSQINYTLNVQNPNEALTKEKNIIIASGEIGGYKQNLKLELNTSQYLNLLKYSIFSN